MLLHAAFWGVGLLSMLCLVSFAAAQGARHGRGEAFLWSAAVTAPVLCLAGWGIAFVIGHRAEGCHPIWLAYAAGWALAFIAGTAAVIARAVRRGPEGSLAGASWSRLRLLWTAVFSGLLAEQSLRVMDRAQLAGLAADVPAWRRKALALLTRPEVPGDENAAPLYDEAFHLLASRGEHEYGGVEDLAVFPDFDGGRKDARERLEELDEVVRLLGAASARSAMHHPIDVDSTLESGSWRPFQRASSLLQLDARVEAASGDLEEAFAGAIRLWRLVGHALEAGQGRTDVVGVITLAIEAASTTENLIADAGGRGPPGAIPWWIDIPFQEEASRLLECERALEHIRWGSLGKRGEEPAPPDPDLPPHLQRSALERFLDATGRRLYRSFVLPGVLENGSTDIGRLVEIFMRESDARECLARAGLAAAAHRSRRGEYPARLEDLVFPGFLDAVPLDPFGGKPLRLTAAEGGLIIYSVGRNGADDGGAEPGAAGKEGDITFRLGKAFEIRRVQHPLPEPEEDDPPPGEE